MVSYRRSSDVNQLIRAGCLDLNIGHCKVSVAAEKKLLRKENASGKTHLNNASDEKPNVRTAFTLSKSDADDLIILGIFISKLFDCLFY